MSATMSMLTVTDQVGAAPRPATRRSEGFRGPQAASLAGITYRQLDYWSRNGLVTPTGCAASGSGTQRIYRRADLIGLVIVKTLLDAGVSHFATRKAVEFLQHASETDLTGMNLVLCEDSPTLTPDSGIVEVVQSGGTVIKIVVLGPILANLQRRIDAMFPSGVPMT